MGGGAVQTFFRTPREDIDVREMPCGELEIGWGYSAEEGEG